MPGHTSVQKRVMRIMKKKKTILQEASSNV